MRVAVVNNGASVPEKILSLLGENPSTIFTYSEVSNIRSGDFDLVVLSGSSQFPITYNQEKLQDEIALIQESAIPILGICYGCELIAIAFGGTLKDMGRGGKEQDTVHIDVVKDSPMFQGRGDFLVYDAHRWVIDTIPDTIEVLARSAHGPEIIKHKTRPIYGFQFHPEKMVEETFGDELFSAFTKQEVIDRHHRSN